MLRENISFTVQCGEREFTVNTYAGEYRNLMVLLNEKIYLDNFGECGGMGRCATCVVEVAGIRGQSARMDRNEPYTLERAGISAAGYRLACQLAISPDLENSRIIIPDDI